MFTIMQRVTIVGSDRLAEGVSFGEIPPTGRGIGGCDTHGCSTTTPYHSYRYIGLAISVSSSKSVLNLILVGSSLQG